MFRLFLAAFISATASAFVSMARMSNSRVSLSMAMSDLPGAIAPLGFFDPVGILVLSLLNKTTLTFNIIS